ncbi:hypothetical protein QE422_000571 [Chryseobacterium sp. SORGH_AS 447]|uniref:hypothetical protein n=1 Tax=Chryseobacterium sp. SORGH_AS_0447 TaxID=3041769 RepID=UPI00277DD156|nr:hypothetical protein [Chryseobacterium sp. SORGH_AS_0447]MDQ1160203.1 hypothetical protein [Chryseobacterium sp. SORGH_AS_0447]
MNANKIMKYKNYNYSDKSDVSTMLANNQNVIETIIGAINGIDDQKWLEEMCIKYILNDDFGIARTAIYGIGDIARIYKKLLNKKEIQKKFGKVTNENLKFVIKEVNDDLEIFLK